MLLAFHNYLNGYLNTFLSSSFSSLKNGLKSGGDYFSLSYHADRKHGSLAHFHANKTFHTEHLYNSSINTPLVSLICTQTQR